MEQPHRTFEAALPDVADTAMAAMVIPGPFWSIRSHWYW